MYICCIYKETKTLHAGNTTIVWFEKNNVSMYMWGKHCTCSYVFHACRRVNNKSVKLKIRWMGALFWPTSCQLQ